MSEAVAALRRDTAQLTEARDRYRPPPTQRPPASLPAILPTISPTSLEGLYIVIPTPPPPPFLVFPAMVCIMLPGNVSNSYQQIDANYLAQHSQRFRRECLASWSNWWARLERPCITLNLALFSTWKAFSLHSYLRVPPSQRSAGPSGHAAAGSAVPEPAAAGGAARGKAAGPRAYVLDEGRAGRPECLSGDEGGERSREWRSGAPNRC
jgi:hypothetical protein